MISIETYFCINSLKRKSKPVKIMPVCIKYRRVSDKEHARLTRTRHTNANRPRNRNATRYAPNSTAVAVFGREAAVTTWTCSGNRFLSSRATSCGYTEWTLLPLRARRRVTYDMRTWTTIVRLSRDQTTIVRSIA